MDSPPYGLMSDATLLMPLSDVTLLVVRQQRTKLDTVEQLSDLYHNGKLPRTGLVLNDVRMDTYGYRYGYGYGYGHGYGYYEDTPLSWRQRLLARLRSFF
jgi:Mrp family chromosome partitioning ATPase